MIGGWHNTHLTSLLRIETADKKFPNWSQDFISDDDGAISLLVYWLNT